MAPMKLVSHGCSERGPRPYHEDALAWDAGAGVFVVADGVSSGGGGDLAAQAAVASIVESAQQAPNAEAWGVAEGTLARAQVAVSNVGQEHRGLGCRTTAAALVIRNGMAVAAWVGDSRVYRMREGVLTLLTTDHRTSRHVLARWLGPSSMGSRSEPELFGFDVQQGDVFALVTDGVGDTVGMDVVLESLLLWPTHGDASPSGVSMAAERIVKESLLLGSTDNCTALVVRVLPA